SSFSSNAITTTLNYTLSLHDALPIFEYMRLAGEQALRRSHSDEALTHARAALDLLGALPDASERLRAEMALQLIIAKALLVGRRSEEHTSELQSRENLVCRLLLEKKK